MTVAVIIVAAGRGRRMGSELPKQYLDIGGATVLRRTVEVFLAHPLISFVRVMIHGDDRTLYDEALAGLKSHRLLDPMPGGATRAETVHFGLETLEDCSPDFVLIHDAARPFVPDTVISNVIGALEQAEGSCAALPIVDALWTSAGGVAGASVPRDGLWRAQTPQGFHYDKIRAAHRLHDGHGADDVAVAREAEMDVRFVLGHEQNYKITTRADIERAALEVQALDPPLELPERARGTK